MAKQSVAAQRKDLMRVCEALEVRYGRRKSQKFEDFIEALVYQILELCVPERSSKEALRRIKSEYVDWNDMRVATIREIQDILGPRYARCREKAEDLSSLLADLYTAFRRMDLTDLAQTPEGIETLRALPETTLIREDMVERALLEFCGIHTFPCNDEQFRLLKYLGGIGKNLALEPGRRKVEQSLDAEEMLRLSRGLREHTEFLAQAGEDEPQPISYGWNKPDPLAGSAGGKSRTKKTGARKGAAKGGSKSAPASSAKKSGAKKTGTGKSGVKKKSGAAKKKTGTRKTPAKSAKGRRGS